MSREELYRRLDALRHGALPNADIYHTIHELGRQNLLEAQADVEQLLTNDDPQLRYIALEVLTMHWRLPEHWKTARDFLYHDPDGNNRTLGASTLGDLMRNTKDRDTLKTLAFVVHNDHEDRLIRLNAYMVIKKVLHDDRQEQWHMLTHQGRAWREIDWTLVGHAAFDAAFPEPQSCLCGRRIIPALFVA